MNLFLCLVMQVVSVQFVFTQGAAAASALNANEMVKKADRFRMPEGSFSVKADVKDYNDKKLLQQTRYKVYTKGVDRSVVETIFPERQQGRKLLMIENDIWFFTPDIKRATRVSFQQKLTGQVANGDLSRTDFTGDYDAEIIKKEIANKVSAIKLKLKSRHDGVTYRMIYYWLRASDYAPLHAQFMTEQGKVLKTGVYSNFKKILGRSMASKVTFTDALNPKKYSTIVYSGHKREKLDESFFNKESLSH